MELGDPGSWHSFGALRCIVLAAALFVAACAERKSPEPDPTTMAKAAVLHPLSPEQTQEMMGDVGENWLYGNGLGETAIAVGSIVAFPPAALYWIGSVAAGAAGYETGVSAVLPEEERAQWNGFYDDISGAPGKLSAAMAGREFISRDLAKERLQKFIPVTPNSEQEKVKEGVTK